MSKMVCTCPRAVHRSEDGTFVLSEVRVGRSLDCEACSPYSHEEELFFETPAVQQTVLPSAPSG